MTHVYSNLTKILGLTLVTTILKLLGKVCCLFRFIIFEILVYVIASEEYLFFVF
jgi:hypothetical protein